MRAIGLRATTKEIYYCIVEEQNETINIVVVDKLVVPPALEPPLALTYIRTSFISILGEYEVPVAGIKVIEGNSQSMDRFRLNIEGVLQELLANSTVERYFTATKSTLGKYLNLTPTQIVDCIKGATDALEYSIDNWARYKQEERESVLTAISALKVIGTAG